MLLSIRSNFYKVGYKNFNLCGFIQTSVAQALEHRRVSMFIASSSDSAGSSDAEYSEVDILDSNTKGEIVKEGFLMKKVKPIQCEM